LTPSLICALPEHDRRAFRLEPVVADAQRHPL